MRSDLKRLAFQILSRYADDCDDVQFFADVWNAHNFAGWGVRASWLSRSHPEIGRIEGMCSHTDTQEEAQAIVDAIERLRSLRYNEQAPSDKPPTKG